MKKKNIKQKNLVRKYTCTCACVHTHTHTQHHELPKIEKYTKDNGKGMQSSTLLTRLLPPKLNIDNTSKLA